jgi:hypothetical protein
LSHDSRLHRWLLALGMLGVILTQLMIIANTSTTIIFWDGLNGGGSSIVGSEVLVPFWVYPLRYMSATVFILGLVFYVRHWYLTRL